MSKTSLTSLGLALAGWSLYSSVLFVDQAEYVYVTCFGRHVVTYDGATDAGWRWKAPWPIMTAVRLDRRLQYFDLPTQELLVRDRDARTGESKSLPLTFDLYVCWRITSAPAPDDPYQDAVDQFVKTFGTLERAQEFLRSQIISRLKIELSHVPLEELVNTDPSRLRTGAMLTELRTRPYRQGSEEPAASLAERVHRLALEIVDVGLRRFNHPPQVRDEIFAKIREDRKREANNYRLQGEEQAAAIRAEGELEARRIRAEAEADRIRREGEARAEATRLLNEAHS
ncbi:MAG: hypothetical protein C4297_06990 [Gemmataceae bacterium]|mgnify:CR=1 FL=1